MATESTTWISTDGALDLAGSWDNGVPDSAIEPTVAIFDASSVVNASSGLATFAAHRVIVNRAYTGNWGTLGDPVILTSALGHINHRGTGTLNLKGLVGDFLTVVVDSPNLVNAMQLDGALGRVWVKDGRVTVLATAQLTESIGVAGNNAVLDIVARTGAEAEPILIVVLSGVLINNRGVANNGIIVVAGGVLDQTKPLSTVAGVTDKVIVVAGQFIYRPDTAQSSTPEMIFGSGLSDISRSRFEIAIVNVVIGPSANLIGDVLADQPWLGSLTSPLDLREDNP